MIYLCSAGKYGKPDAASVCADPTLAAVVRQYGLHPVLAQLRLNAKARTAWARRESGKSVRAARRAALRDAATHPPKNFRAELYATARPSCYGLRRQEIDAKRHVAACEDFAALELPFAVERPGAGREAA